MATLCAGLSTAVRSDIYIYVYVYMYTHTHTHTYIYIYIYIYIQGASNMTGTDCTLFTHKSVPVIFEPPCVCVCIYIYMYMYTHTHTHIYIYIYTQGGSNMTGTDCTLFTHKPVPVIFEPPCVYIYIYIYIYVCVCVCIHIWPSIAW